MISNMKILASALAATALITPTLASPIQKRTPTVSNEVLTEALRNAASESERQKILLPNAPDASNITYTFINNTVNYPTGGTIALAGIDQFPALIGTNVATGLGFVNPCGLNTPHSHPRANELLTVVQGTLIGGLILETNPGKEGNVAGTNPVGALPFVKATLTNYTAMLFPVGSVHWQFNPTCEPAVFVAAFDSSDPGRTQIARNFFSVQPNEVLESAVGGDLELLEASRIDSLRGVIPAAYAELMDSCAVTCGLTTGTSTNATATTGSATAASSPVASGEGSDSSTSEEGSDDSVEGETEEED